MTSLIQTLPPGSLDIIGDIHGEIESMLQLLEKLGYDHDGNHPDQRHIVFVGDYCDRGPDSPAVIALVQKLVRNKRASAILGNHELNLLRDDAKDGSGWYFDSQYEHDHQKFGKFARATVEEKQAIHEFLLSLPIALEREDIRIVHAAWDTNAMAQLRARNNENILALYEEWHQATKGKLGKLQAQVEREKLNWPHSLHNQHYTPPMFKAHAAKDVTNQNNNPLRVLTSGLERDAQAPFYTSGKWRFAERVKWWDDYEGSIPVVVGHYWRQPQTTDRSIVGKGDANLFEGIAPDAWHGKYLNVFCVDFSVGGKWSARKHQNGMDNHFLLGAMRWPEKNLIHTT